MMSLLLVDDHPIVCRGLRRIFDCLGPVEEAACGREALQKLSGCSYDVVILDMILPDLDGLEVLKQIRSLCPKTAVLVLSGHPEEVFALRTLKSGAAGYWTKDQKPEVLLDAVRTVVTGRKYITPSVGHLLAQEVERNGGDRPLHEQLSDREFQVLMSIAAGSTMRRLAEKLSLSEKTVSTYRSRVLQKTGLKNNAAIISYAIEHGLLGGERGRYGTEQRLAEIRHQLRNMLTGIQCISSAMADDMPAESPTHKDIKYIQDCCKEASRIIERL